MSEQEMVTSDPENNDAEIEAVVAPTEAAESSAPDVVEAATEAASDVVDAVMEAASDVVEAATEATSDVVEAAAEAAPDVVETTPGESSDEAPAAATAEVEQSAEAPAAATAEAEPTETSAAAAPEAESEGDDASDTIHTLKRGQALQGRVKNITQFGAFVDVGLPQDGLVHISELSRKKVEKVSDAVSEGQDVDVWVKKVDTKRGRISLTMIKPIALRLRDISDDAQLAGRVTRLESYGAFVDIGSERDGLVHISQITHDYINHPQESLAVGDEVQVKVLKVNRKKRQIDLSIKALLTPPVRESTSAQKEIFEDVGESEPQEEVPTAMALAYAAMQNKDDEPTDAQHSFDSESSKQRQALNDVINRTLATNQEG